MLKNKYRYFLLISINLFLCWDIIKYQIFGSYKTWGYGEFLINYSQGFIRRGLPGTILLWLYRIFGITPFLVLLISITFSIVLTSYFTFQILNSFQNLSNLKFTVLILNPSLILFYGNGNFMRKDCFIVLLLVSHTFISLKIQLGRVRLKSYLIFLTLLFFAQAALSCSHEINIYFIPLHLFIINYNLRFLKVKRIQINQVLGAYLASQGFFLLLILRFHGDPAVVDKIILDLTRNFGDGDYSAVHALGWTFQENFELVKMMLHPITLIGYSCVLLCGPILIYVLLVKSKFHASKPLIYYLVGVQLLLLLSGWDWGRWISICAFACVSIAPFILENSYVEANSQENILKMDLGSSYIVKVMFFLVLIVLLLAIAVPGAGPRPIYGFRGSVFLHFILDNAPKLLHLW